MRIVAGNVIKLDKFALVSGKVYKCSKQYYIRDKTGGLVNLETGDRIEYDHISETAEFVEVNALLTVE